MNLYARRWGQLAAVVGVLVLAGCSTNKSQSEPPEAVTPAGTLDEIWTQIGAERSKLSAAIQNGELKDVHHLAFGIRDLVIALADKANAASPANASRLNDMVEQVKASATKLDELGDAGNLSGTQAEFAGFQTVLDAMKSLTGGK